MSNDFYDWRIERDRKTAEKRAQVRHFVYFLHDADGEVIYVGCSGDILARLRGHFSVAQRSGFPDAWFYAVRSITLAGPFNWEDARARESAEIETREPIYNIANTTRDPRPAVASRVAWQKGRAS